MTEQIPSSGSITAENREKEKKPRSKGKPFVKGDPRINRHGRPKGYEEARKAVISMLGEVMGTIDVVDPVTKEKQTIKVTRFQSIIMDWLTSRNFQKQKEVLAIAGMLNKGDLPIQMNVDVRSLTNDQLDRLIKGENILDVLKKT